MDGFRRKHSIVKPNPRGAAYPYADSRCYSNRFDMLCLDCTRPKCIGEKTAPKVRNVRTNTY